MVEFPTIEHMCWMIIQIQEYTKYIHYKELYNLYLILNKNFNKNW